MKIENTAIIIPNKHRYSIYVKLLCLIYILLFTTTAVHASITSNTSQFKVSSNPNNEVSLFSWLFGSETYLSELPPFSIEHGHYVYRGGELLTSYSLDAPLYIEDHMVVKSSITAKSIVINADVEIVSKNEKEQRIVNSGLESLEDFTIRKQGSISMEKGTIIKAGGNFKSESTKDISLDNGTIIINGDICIRNKWKSNDKCILKIDGEKNHFLKGDKACSVGLLAISETALNSTKIKKHFWQTEPKVFNVEKFSIKLPDSMIVQDYSSEISKTLHCQAMQSDTPYHIQRFAQNYLYTVLYCNGNMGNVSIDIFDAFFNAKANGVQIDNVVCQDEKALYLDVQRKVHPVRIDLSYIGVRTSKESKSIGLGQIVVKDEGRNYQFEFYPVLSEDVYEIDEFVNSLRKGASEVIKDQIKAMVIGQAIADLADISAPEAFDLDIGNAICEGNSIYEFLKELDSFTKKWNKMKNGLTIESDTKIKTQANEEHPKAANEVDAAGDGSSGSTDNSIDKKNTYIDVINALSSQYGPLRIVENDGEWKKEANGLCYLNLIDFTGDGEDELFAVCKNEEENHYIGYIYTIKSGTTELIYENPKIEYNTAYAYDIVYMGYTKDTGFIFGTGWDAPDIDDRTFFWYKDGNFEPVYRSKGYYDDGLQEEIIEEELKIVDIFDDNHLMEFYNSSHPTVTLRTMEDDDENSDIFDSNNLQKTIDDTIRKLGVDLKDLPESITFSEEKMGEIARVAIFNCIEKDFDEWTPGIEDTETFWDTMCFYCNFTDWINTVEYPRVGEYEKYRVIPNDLLKNAAYAIYKDFNGNLPGIDDGVWRARHYNEEATGITVGDTAPIMITSEKYQKRNDGTIDAEYVIEHSVNIPAGTYKVYFEPNLHYDEVNAGVSYYYCVSRVELIDKPSINVKSAADGLTMEEFGIPYGHYYGGKPQGEGVCGLEMDLYEDMTFSIKTAFDLFSDEDGDEYYFTGTYRVDRINNDGNPVLLLHCDEGDYEFVWDGEDLVNDPVFAWYEEESSKPEGSNSDSSSTKDYQEVINEYRAAYDDFELYREDEDTFMEKYPLVNVNALIEPYLSSIDLTFFSAIKDINKDGVDELIIGVGFEKPNSIYTRQGNQIIPLINDIGERSFINIYNDGTIYRYDSGGASFGIATFYEMNESGDGLNTIKQFEADWDRDPDYPYYDGTESLSPEQFQEEYVDKKEMELQWAMEID